MEKLNSAGKRYLWEIRKEIPCPAKRKRRILVQIRGILGEYLAQNPDADYAAITARLGSPQQIAASYVDDMGTGELLRGLTIRRKILRRVSIAVAIMVALWVGVVAVSYANHIRFTDGYYIDDITVVEDISTAEGE